MNIRVRIIKGRRCKKCDYWLPTLDKIGFKYEIYDADDPAHQTKLDEWGIEDMPVIQLIDDDDVVKDQFSPGTFSARAINFKIKKLKLKT